MEKLSGDLINEMNERKFPEVGEVVLATVKEITPYGAYVTLDEYGGTIGFLHISEISTGWVKNIERYIKERQKIVLKVIRVNEKRNEIDLSLRQVSREERKQKLIEVKRETKAKALLDMVKREVGIEDDKEYRRILETEFRDLYDALENVVKKGPSVLTDLGIDNNYANALYKIVKERIKIPQVEVSGILEIYSPRPDGVEVVKEVLKNAVELGLPDVKVKIVYLGSPRFKISVIAENYKVAEKALSMVLNRIEKGIKKKGMYSFKREKK